MANPILTIAPPVRRARKGGLLDVVWDIRDNVDYLAASENVQYISEGCDLGHEEITFCYAANADVDPKTAEGIDTFQGFIDNFGFYKGVQCWLSEGSDEEYARRARQALEWTESRAIESKLAERFETIPPAAAATLVTAIGQLEELADTQYPGLPLLHINRVLADAAVAAGVLLVDDGGDGRIWTPHGTPVVSSGMYAGDMVVLTGAITVLRSAIGAASGYELTANTNLAIAERVYGVAVDCDFAVAVPITTE